MATLAGGAASLAHAQSITTGFGGTTTIAGTGYNGNFFDITDLSGGGLTINSWEINSNQVAGTPLSVRIYYKAGTWNGFHTDPTAWTLLGEVPATAAGPGLPTPVALGGLNIPANQTYGIRIGADPGALRYHGATATVPVSNTDVRLDFGSAQGTLWAGIAQPRGWNGTVYYQLGNPQPGACCLPSGSCTVTLPGDCFAQSGVYQGANTTCSSPCPQPGACCLPGGACDTMVASQCTAQGGYFLGENTPCGTCLGEVAAGPYDVEGPTTDNRALGVEVAWGHLWVSGTGAVPGPGSQRIHKFTLTGDYVTSYNQVTNSPATAYWGGRDGAADEAANKLWFGAENGELSEYDYDPSTGGLTHSQIHAIPILGAVRALARHPNGNFYTADFSGQIFEFTLTPSPQLVNTFPNTANNGGPFAYYGFAWDEVNGTLWGWSQNGPAAGTNQQVRATELDPATMQATGRFFYGIIHPPGAPSTHQNIAGGADIMCNHPANPGRLSFVGLHQTAPDVVVVYDLLTPCGGGSACYANCDNSTQVPFLNVGDFGCFLGKFAAGDPYANCDGSTQEPILNVADFGCFLGKFAAGCSAP